MDKPDYDSEYYAICTPDVYEGYKIVLMIWLDTEQNYRDLNSKNIYKTYGEAFDIICDY